MSAFLFLVFLYLFSVYYLSEGKKSEDVSVKEGFCGGQRALGLRVWCGGRAMAVGRKSFLRYVEKKV